MLSQEIRKNNCFLTEVSEDLKANPRGTKRALGYAGRNWHSQGGKHEGRQVTKLGIRESRPIQSDRMRTLRSAVYGSEGERAIRAREDRTVHRRPCEKAADYPG